MLLAGIAFFALLLLLNAGLLIIRAHTREITTGERVYECICCRRLLVACPRCGHMLHSADEPHLDAFARWCGGRDLAAEAENGPHPALLNTRAVARDLLARRGRAASGVTG